MRVYTMRQWQRDGVLKVRAGQSVTSDVIEQLSEFVPPSASGNGLFQNGEPEKVIDGRPYYLTFERIDNKTWHCLGLYPPPKPLSRRGLYLLERDGTLVPLSTSDESFKGLFAAWQSFTDDAGDLYAFRESCDGDLELLPVYDSKCQRVNIGSSNAGKTYRTRDGKNKETILFGLTIS